MGIKNVAKVNKSEFRLSITLRIAPPIPNICASNTISLRPRWLTYYFPSFTYENKTLSMKHLHHHMAPYVEYLNLIWCWQEIVVDPYVEYVNLIWSWQEIFVAPYVKYLNLISCWQEIVMALYVKYLNLIWCVGKWWCMCAMTIMDNRLRQQGQSKDWAQLVCMVYERGNFTKWQSLALEVIEVFGLPRY
jgi:hypothetical protein